MIVRCGACGKSENAATLLLSGGLKLDLLGSWRARNADVGHPRGGAVVFLCSDICEKRYSDEIGFVPGIVEDRHYDTVSRCRCDDVDDNTNPPSAVHCPVHDP